LGLGWDADKKGSLEKMGTLFKELVADKGVFEAARCMVELLLPKE